MHTYVHGGLKKLLLAVCTVIGWHEKAGRQHQHLVHNFMMTLLCTILSARLGTATPYTLQLVKLGTYYIVRSPEVLYFELCMRV